MNLQKSSQHVTFNKEMAFKKAVVKSWVDTIKSFEISITVLRGYEPDADHLRTSRNRLRKPNSEPFCTFWKVQFQNVT
jgi:hypothetical protein